MRETGGEEALFLSTIRRHAMLQPGDRVIVGLSGGADSVALFHLLLKNRLGLGIQLQAAHLNHGLRGAAAEEDEAFVRRLCEANDVPLHLRRADMALRPKPKGEGAEAWGRRLRYAFFDELAFLQNAKVATGHTGSDNAETLLFNAARGSFTAGLAGIPPVRGPYIRPLLAFGRGQVRAYCKQMGYAYRQDASNEELIYSRNRLRLQVMPELEAAHPGAEKALCRLAEDMRSLDAWLLQQAQAGLAEARRLAEGREKPEGWFLQGYDAETLLALPAPVRLRALAALLGRAATRTALSQMEEVLSGVAGMAQLPGGLMARRSGGRFLLVPPALYGGAGDELLAEQAPKMGRQPLPFGYVLTSCIEEATGCVWEKQKKEKKDYTFWADYDKMNPYVIRTRRKGDFFAEAGRQGTKTLKKWMIEKGIDRELRGRLPLLARPGSGQVLWVFGAGFSSEVQVAQHSRRQLHICTEYLGKEEAGG